MFCVVVSNFVAKSTEASFVFEVDDYVREVNAYASLPAYSNIVVVLFHIVFFFFRVQKPAKYGP